MKKILLIEDDEYLRDLLIPLLKDRGYAIDSAEDGMTALKKLQGEIYDIILLDKNLPHVDGGEILSLIKMHKQPPRVIVITGDEKQDTRSEMLFQGADAYLEKPFEVKDLIRQIETK